jgi:NADH dehydrogenase FAD-containing subunit
MGKALVIAGAGHAHLAVLKHLEELTARGHRVTVVGPGRFHYYSGMGPGMLAGIYRPEEIRFDVAAMARRRGAAFVEDRVVRIDPRKRRIVLAGGAELPYDIASFNTGSHVPVAPPLQGGGGALVPVKPIENLRDARERISARLAAGADLALVVAGGGAAGLEVAANLARLSAGFPGRAAITLAAARRLMPEAPPGVRRRAMKSLSRRGVAVREGARVNAFRDRTAELASGDRLACDFLFLAAGVRPGPLFAASGIPTGGDGGLLVNARLQSVAHPEIFGGGDCICFGPRPIARVGVYAVRQNPILRANLAAALDGGRLLEFQPQKDYLLAFNLGDGTAIVCWKGLVFGGRLGFLLKDYLDRRFMRMFRE